MSVVKQVKSLITIHALIEVYAAAQMLETIPGLSQGKTLSITLTAQQYHRYKDQFKLIIN